MQIYTDDAVLALTLSGDHRLQWTSRMSRAEAAAALRRVADTIDAATDDSDQPTRPVASREADACGHIRITGGGMKERFAEMTRHVAAAHTDHVHLIAQERASLPVDMDWTDWNLYRLIEDGTDHTVDVLHDLIGSACDGHDERRPETERSILALLDPDLGHPALYAALNRALRLVRTTKCQIIVTSHDQAYFGGDLRAHLSADIDLNEREHV